MNLKSKRENQISTILTAIIVAAGVIGQALIYAIFGIEIEDVPVVTMVVLWISISGIVKDVLGRWEEIS